MRLSTITASVLALSCSLFTGCASSMAIRSMQPGVVFVGSTNHLVIVDGQGRRSAREYTNMEIVRQARQRGYFSVEDKSDQGLEVRVAGRNARVEGGAFTLDSGQAGLRVDVLEWDAYRATEEHRSKDEKGEPVVDLVPIMQGKALLAVTFFDADGRAFLAEKEYEGFSSCPPQSVREDAIEAAAANAIAQFLNDITPVQVTSRVRLDEEDDGQEHILATAKAGNLALAAKDMRAYLDANPLSPSAAYNLAVFLDGTGDYAAAMEMYDQALSLGGKDYYAAARSGCNRRLSAAEALR